MNHLSLKYFLVVAQEMNFTRSAKKLFISQQSLSEHIAKLEAEYQVKLFERSPRLSLTYAGRCLRELAEKVMDLESQIEAELLDISQQRRVCLSVGMTPVYGRVLLPRILPLFCAQHPNIEVRFTLENSERILNLLLENHLDLALSFRPLLPSAEIEMVDFLQDRFCLVASPRMLERYFEGESMDQTSFTIQNFRSAPFLMSLPGSRLRAVADIYLQEEGVNPNVLLESRDLETLFSLCREGMGFMFAFELFVRHRIEENPLLGEMRCIPIESSAFDGDLKFAVHRNRYQKLAIRSFIDCAASVCHAKNNKSTGFNL